MTEAVAYEEDKEVGRTTLKTPGNCRRIRIDPEELPVDGELIYLDLSVTDEENNLSYSQIKIRVEVEGAVVLAAFGTGNAKGEESYQSSECILYNGHALLVLRKRDKGRFYVKAVVEEVVFDRKCLEKNIRNIKEREYVAYV